LKRDISKLDIENESEERRLKSQQQDHLQKAPEVEAQKKKIIEQEKIILDLELEIKRQNIVLEELIIKRQTQEKQITSKHEKSTQLNERIKTFDQNLKASEKEIHTLQVQVEEKQEEIG
jgi:predicted  nucleic acid-binding Zn-ribbon protein